MGRTNSARTSRSRSPSSYRISNLPSRCAFSTVPLNQRSLPLKRASHLSPSRRSEPAPGWSSSKLERVRELSAGGEFRMLVRGMARTKSARTSRSRSPSSYRISNVPSRCAFSTVPLNQRSLPLKRASHLSPSRKSEEPPLERELLAGGELRMLERSTGRTNSARTSRSRSPSSYRISNVPSRCAFSTVPLNQRSLPLKRASHLSPSRNVEEPPAPLPERLVVAAPPARGRTNSARTSRSRSPSAYRMSKLPSRFARSTSPLNQRNLPLKRASHLSPATSRPDFPPRRGVSMSADRERAIASSGRTSSARTSRSRSPSSYRISNVPSRCAFSTVPLNQRSLPLKRASHLSPSRRLADEAPLAPCV